MSTSISSAHEPGLQETPAIQRPTHPLYWSVLSELWEFRSIYIVPMAAAAVFLIAFAINMRHWGDRLRSVEALNPAQIPQFIQRPYDLAALLMMGATLLVAIYYCLETLHAERRDRSILFWKSLPVSDLTSILAKASVPIFILPLITIIVVVVLHCFMALIGATIAGASGFTAAGYWHSLSLVRVWLVLLYHMVAIHGLLFSPFYGWMLLISAWARRAPLLWATIPWLIVAILQQMIFGTDYLGALFQYSAMNAPASAAFPPDHVHPMTMTSLGKFLISPGLWISLVITTAFLFLAARIRRTREPI
jgi:ABC-2 type transport system permease protein